MEQKPQEQIPLFPDLEAATPAKPDTQPDLNLDPITNPNKKPDFSLFPDSGDVIDTKFINGKWIPIYRPEDPSAVYRR